MENRLFIGNLPWSIDDAGLRDLFASYGDVKDAHVAVDKFTKRSRGFGFVEFGTADEANAAIDAMNGKEVDGRPITVNIARAKEAR
jgi:RNA recognition motif-containing protein